MLGWHRRRGNPCQEMRDRFLQAVMSAMSFKGHPELLDGGLFIPPLRLMSAGPWAELLTGTPSRGLSMCPEPPNNTVAACEERCPETQSDRRCVPL